MATRTVGFTYVLSNPAMPDIVKVGYTTARGEARAKELNPTAVPLPYVVEFGAMTSFPGKVRARAHQMLDWNRVAPDRDFFRVAPHLAIEGVRDALLDVAGLAAWGSGAAWSSGAGWSPDAVHQVRTGDRIALAAQEGDMFVVLAHPSRAAERAVPVDLWQAHSDGDVLELTAGGATSAAGLSDHGAGTGLFQAGCPDPRYPGTGLHDHGVATAPDGTVNGRERLVPGDRLLWLRPATEGRPCMRAAFEFSAYCHVVSRTWAPKFTSDGAPLRLAFPDADEQPACVVQAIQDALALPPPRAWAPREPDPEDGWLAAAEEAPPEQQLTQLGKRRRSRAKNAAASHAPAGQLPLW